MAASVSRIRPSLTLALALALSLTLSLALTLTSVSRIRPSSSRTATCGSVLGARGLVPAAARRPARALARLGRSAASWMEQGEVRGGVRVRARVSVRGWGWG